MHVCAHKQPCITQVCAHTIAIFSKLSFQLTVMGWRVTGPSEFSTPLLARQSFSASVYLSSGLWWRSSRWWWRQVVRCFIAGNGDDGWRSKVPTLEVREIDTFFYLFFIFTFFFYFCHVKSMAIIFFIYIFLYFFLIPILGLSFH